MSITPNMLLELPDVSVTPGPEWAALINQLIQVIDDHDHTPDKGKLVPISGVDINQDLDMENLSILDTKSVKFQNLVAALSGALNANRLHVINGNIWFTNAGGIPVQITDGNTIVSNVIVPSSPLMPSGSILDFAGAAPPVGFLLCDGTAVSRTTYSDLFAAVGTTWGVGDGATTFNLPNLNGRTSIGSGTFTDAVSGSITRSVGQIMGTDAHVLTTAQMPSHNHTQNPHSHTISNFNASLIDGGPSGGYIQAGGTISTNSSTATNNPEGGGLAHNNMQPSAVVVKMIKT